MASDTGTSLHDRPVIPVLTSGGTASEPFPAHLGKRYLPQPSVHRRNDLQSSHRRCLSPSLLSPILPLVIDLVRVPPTVPNTPYKPYNRPLTASCHQRARAVMQRGHAFVNFDTGTHPVYVRSTGILQNISSIIWMELNRLFFRSFFSFLFSFSLFFFLHRIRSCSRLGGPRDFTNAKRRRSRRTCS